MGRIFGGILAIGIAAGALMLALPARTSASVSLAPNTWEIKVAAGECTLERSFTAPMAATLSIRTRIGSDQYRLALAGKDLPGGGRARSVDLIFGKQDRRFESTGNMVSLGGQMGNGIVLHYLEPEAIDAFGRASSLTLQLGEKPYGPFALPMAASAVAAFRTCIGDQLVEWGADPAQFAPGGATPVALKSRDLWLTNAQLISMAKDAGGDRMYAMFRLVIAEDGSIAGCTRTDGGDGKRIERIACAAVLTKKLFTPARDAQGKPVRGVATFEADVVRRPGRV